MVRAPCGGAAAEKRGLTMTTTTGTDLHFLTGYPDFLCRCLFRELLASDRKARLALLVQPKYAKEAQREVAALDKRQAARVELLLGDVVDMHLGLAGDEYRRLLAETTVVHHLAAVANPAAGRPTLERVNVDGTRHILELCREAQRLARLNHVSTVYVAGDRHGVIEEDELEEGQRFHDAVEETRFKAEVLVRKAMRHLPATVYRPSTVVGDSRTGEAGRFEGPDYLAVRLVTSPLRVPLPLPGDGSYPLNVVPADFVAKAIVALTREPRAVGRTFHLVDPNPLAARKVYEYVARRANKRTPKVGIPARASVALLRLPVLEKLARPQRTALEHLTGVAIFGCRNTLELLDPTGIRCPPLFSYLDKLIDDALERDRKAREARAAERHAAEDPLAPPPKPAIEVGPAQPTAGGGAAARPAATKRAPGKAPKAPRSPKPAVPRTKTETPAEGAPPAGATEAT
jgi:thioester reductase-like protein